MVCFKVGRDSQWFVLKLGETVSGLFESWERQSVVCFEVGRDSQWFDLKLGETVSGLF